MAAPFWGGERPSAWAVAPARNIDKPVYKEAPTSIDASHTFHPDLTIEGDTEKVGEELRKLVPSSAYGKKSIQPKPKPASPPPPSFKPQVHIGAQAAALRKTVPSTGMTKKVHNVQRPAPQPRPRSKFQPRLNKTSLNSPVPKTYDPAKYHPPVKNDHRQRIEEQRLLRKLEDEALERECEQRERKLERSRKWKPSTRPSTSREVEEVEMEEARKAAEERRERQRLEDEARRQRILELQTGRVGSGSSSGSGGRARDRRAR